MNRTPPKVVTNQLRNEVGYGCPVPDCGSPYLYWHHFDPPWSEREHHDPAGMIALCGEHHPIADGGAYTKEQLHEFKTRAQAQEIKGRLEWMRHRLLVVAGGNFYYETPVIVQLRDQPLIWFNRDDDGYMLLNLLMPSLLREERLRVEDNFWRGIGNPQTFECPPSGKLVKVKYDNDDSLQVRFFELDSPESVLRLPSMRTDEMGQINVSAWQIDFPITGVEVNLHAARTGLSFSPTHTIIATNTLRGNFFSHVQVGIQVG